MRMTVPLAPLINMILFSFLKWFPDVVVTIYRCIFAGYCLGWIIYSGFHPANGDEKWFIYLTNWGFTFVTLYFIWATVVSILHHFGVANYAAVMQMKATRSPDSDAEGGDGLSTSIDIEQPVMGMSWYHKGLWVVFNIAANAAILITLLYWTLIFTGKTSVLDVTTHLINSVVIVADIMLSANPVRILHVVYALILGVCYILLTVIFWAVNGTNARGEPYIYSYIDYNKSPGFTSGLLVGFVLVGQPLVQALLFGLYKLRCFLGQKCGKKI